MPAAVDDHLRGGRHVGGQHRVGSGRATRESACPDDTDSGPDLGLGHHWRGRGDALPDPTSSARARLARLGLTDGGAVDGWRGRANHIVDQYAILARLDTDDVPPTAETIDLAPRNVLRDDVARESLPVEAVAPSRRRRDRRRVSSWCRRSSAGRVRRPHGVRTGPAPGCSRTQLAARLRSGEFSIAPRYEAHLEIADADNHALNASAVDRPRDRARPGRRLPTPASRPPGARATRLSTRFHPLLGVPVALEDLISVEGGPRAQPAHEDSPRAASPRTTRMSSSGSEPRTRSSSARRTWTSSRWARRPRTARIR